MRVVFYISSFSRGGAERVVTTLAKKMNGDQEVFVVTDTISKNEYDLPDVKRINMGYVVYPNVLKRAIHKLQYICKLRKKMQELHPDVVISFSIDSALRMKKAVKNTKIKQIVSVRSNPSVDYKTETEVQNIIAKIQDLDGFVFQTGEQRDFFGKDIAADSVVILNPMAEEFSGKDVEVDKKREVATFGRMTKSKDHATLLRAYDLAAEKLPDYVFSIYGDGELREKMEEIRESLKHKERILLQGECTDVKNKMKQISVFVLSSRNEGLPNALMEAMALSLPVISTDCPCGGPAAIIEHDKNGILVPVGDEVRLAEAIVELCSDTSKAHMLGMEASKIRQTCDADRIANQWIQYMEKVVNG